MIFQTNKQLGQILFSFILTYFYFLSKDEKNVKYLSFKSSLISCQQKTTYLVFESICIFYLNIFHTVEGNCLDAGVKVNFLGVDM